MLLCRKKNNYVKVEKPKSQNIRKMIEATELGLWCCVAQVQTEAPLCPTRKWTN